MILSIGGRLVLIFGWMCIITCLHDCRGSILTNFQLDRLRIKPDKKASYYGLVLNETVSFLQHHYIYRSIYSLSEWLNLRDEAALQNPLNPHDSIRYVLGKIQDPYCRFIEPSIMQGKSENLRGVAVGLGLRLRRRWNFRHLPRLLKYIMFPAITSNNKVDHFVHQAGFVCTMIASVIAVMTKSTTSRQTKLILFPMAIGSLLLRVTPFLRPFEVVDILNDNADNAGMKVGDKLLLVNGRPVPALGSQEHIIRILNRGTVGDIVNMTILREEPFDSRSPHISTSLNFRDQQLPLNPQTAQEHKLQIVRDYILHETIEARLANCIPGKATAYIKIREFSDETYTEFAYAWEKLQKEYELRQLSPSHLPNLQNPSSMKDTQDIFASKSSQSIIPSADRFVSFPSSSKTKRENRITGLVIDLRGNPGGALVPALDIAAMFLPYGSFVTCLASNIAPPNYSESIMGDDSSKRRSTASTERYYSTNRRPDKETAILLLCDEASASASEILIEALCDNGRAISAAPAVPDYVLQDEISRSTVESCTPAYSDARRPIFPGVHKLQTKSPSSSWPMRTVGKNLAQAVISLSDGSGLYFSVREFFAPSGKSMRDGHRPIFTLQDLGTPLESFSLPIWGKMFRRNEVDLDQIYYDTERQEWCTKS